MYTSGSTGQPLGALGTELGIINRCQFQQLRDTDVIAFSTSTTFVDSIIQFMAPLVTGKGTILALQPTMMVTDPVMLIRMIDKYKVTHLTAVPTVWSLLLLRANNSNDEDDVTLRYLRVAVSSGEPLTKQLKIALLTTLLPPSCTLYNIYGCTEAAADCTLFNCTTDMQSCTDNCNAPYVCVGRPMKGFDIHIIPYLDDEEEDGDVLVKVTSLEMHQVPLQPAQEGRIVIRETKPGILALGYLSLNTTTTTQPQSALHLHDQMKDRFITDDNTGRRMFITDDKGWLDKDGNLYIAGRACDLVEYKLGGEKVNVLHIEQVLMKHPDVLNAVVINAKQDNQLVAFIESRTIGTIHLEKKLLLHCQHHLSWPSCPVRIVILKAGTTWPRSEAGKLQRSKVHQWWKKEEEEEEGAGGGGELQDGSSSSSMDIVLESTVHQAVVTALDIDKAGQLVNVEPNDNVFKVGGASSATTVKIAALLGGIDPLLVFKYPSVRSLTRALQKQEEEKRKRTGIQSDHHHFNNNNNNNMDNDTRRKGKKQRQGDALPRTNGSLKMRWKAKLSQCIDAPCLFLLSNQPSSYASKVVACSHGGDISCHDIHTGTMLWNVRLSGRADLGMAALRLPSNIDDKNSTIIAVAVQSPDMIVLLHAVDGRTMLTQHLHHHPGAQPSVTTTGCESRIWVPTHGGLVCIYNIRMMSNNNCIKCDIKTYQLPAPCSAKVTVLTRSEEKRNVLTVIAACLDGSLQAIHISSQGEEQVELLLKADGPLFAPPQLTVNDQYSHHVVLTATVNGRVTAIKSDLVGKSTSSINSSILWSTILLPSPASIFTAMQLWEAGNSAFIGTREGSVYCLDLTSGNIKSSINLGSLDDDDNDDSVTGLYLLPNINTKKTCYCCCTCSNGTIYILKVNNDGQSLNVDDQYQLEGEVFSPPQIVLSTANNSVLVGVGCRDEHLYIIEYNEWT